MPLESRLLVSGIPLVCSLVTERGNESHWPWFLREPLGGGGLADDLSQSFARAGACKAVHMVSLFPLEKQ